jgi:hypothetical protein
MLNALLSCVLVGPGYAGDQLSCCWPSAVRCSVSKHQVQLHCSLKPSAAAALTA